METTVKRKMLAVMLVVAMLAGLVLMPPVSAEEPVPPITVSAFDALAPEVAFQFVEPGTPLASLNLPASLPATIGGESAALDGVTWQCDTAGGYQPDIVGEYIFTPVLPTGYLLAEGATLPQAFVYVEEEQMMMPMAYAGGVFTIASPNGSLQSMIETDLQAAPFNQPAGGPYDYTKVTSLAITGAMAAADYAFIKSSLTALATLDLSGFAGTFPDQAFDHCSSITTVKLPAGVPLSYAMFWGCAGLTTLGIGSNPPVPGVIDLSSYTATSYGNNAFNLCSSITTVKLPAAVPLSDAMFIVCYGLTTLSVGTNPPTANVIDLTGYDADYYGEAVFKSCNAITTVKLPADVGLSNSMFTSCQGLNTLSTGSNVPVPGVIDLSGYTANSYGYQTFNLCTAVTAAKLPANVNISDLMFGHNIQLADVLFLGNTAPSIGGSGFTAPNTIAYVPDKTTGGYQLPAFTNFFSQVLTAAAPNFGTAPQSAAVLAGGDADFTVAASGAPASITYQWQLSTDGGASYTNISGATAATLDIDAVTTTQNGYRYRCVATNLVGSTISTAATLTVNTPAAAGNNTITVGASQTVGVAFSFTATGDRQGASGSLVGETRYVPESWSVNPSGSFPAGGPYTATATIDTAGNYTLSVVFRLQRWDGATWLNEMTTDTKLALLTVRTASAKNVPQTGDDTLVWPWIALGGASLGGLAVCGFIWIKKRRSAADMAE